MRATHKDIERILVALAATPHEIERAVAGLNEEALQSKPARAGWSIAENLAHLRACADVWTFSIYAMLTEANVTLPDLDERRWAQVTAYAALPFDKALGAYATQREELFRVLNVLPFEKWECGAQIAGRRHTVFTQARRLVKHEAVHIEQIKQARARAKKM
jgi:hypothetical protein